MRFVGVIRSQTLIFVSVYDNLFFVVVVLHSFSLFVFGMAFTPKRFLITLISIY